MSCKGLKVGGVKISDVNNRIIIIIIITTMPYFGTEKAKMICYIPKDKYSRPKKVFKIIFNCLPLVTYTILTNIITGTTVKLKGK